MEFCDLDWKAIGSFVSAGATLVGARVAWKISEKWREQKASEEISKECKELVIKLYELETLYLKLDELESIPVGLTYPNNKTKKDIRKEFFNNVKEWKYANNSKFNFVKTLTNSKVLESKIDDLIELLKDFYSHNLIQRFISDDDIKELVKSEETIKAIDNIRIAIIPFIKHSKRG